MFKIWLFNLIFCIFFNFYQQCNVKSSFRGKPKLEELSTSPVIIVHRGDLKSPLLPHSQVLYANTYTNESTQLEARTTFKPSTNPLSRKFTFFTPLLPTNKLEEPGYKYYKGHRWNFIPAKKFGDDIFEIENHDSKQVLLIRYAEYNFGERHLVLTENRDPSKETKDEALWRICMSKNNERFVIQNFYSNEYLFLGGLKLNRALKYKEPANKTVYYRGFGNLAMTKKFETNLKHAAVSIIKPNSKTCDCSDNRN